MCTFLFKKYAGVIKIEKKYYKVLLDLCFKAFEKNEVPIGAIIVKDGKILSKSYNKKNKTHNVLNHAEILAIIKASKKIKTWNLSDCELYVTMEPCPMCKSIINESRIKKVYYYLENNTYKEIKKNEFKKISFKKIDDDNNEIEKIVKEFFKKKRVSKK